MKIDRYVYAYDSEVRVKFYAKKKAVQKIFPAGHVSSAWIWCREKLEELGKHGKEQVGLNRYGLTHGIRVAREKGRKGKMRTVVRVSGGYYKGKHWQTCFSVAKYGLAKAIALAEAKKEEYRKLKEGR